MASNFDGWDDGGTPMWRSSQRFQRQQNVILDGRRQRATFLQMAVLAIFAGFVLPLGIVVVGLCLMGVAHVLGW